MTISTHILDTSLGRPATEVDITLTAPGIHLASSTDRDGRCRFSLDSFPIRTPCTLHFDTASYYAKQQTLGLYPHVDITFTVRPDQTHYHIPLLLTANGYTTYRGS